MAHKPKTKPNIKPTPFHSYQITFPSTLILLLTSSFFNIYKNVKLKKIFLAIMEETTATKEDQFFEESLADSCSRNGSVSPSMLEDFDSKSALLLISGKNDKF